MDSEFLWLLTWLVIGWFLAVLFDKVAHEIRYRLWLKRGRKIAAFCEMRDGISVSYGGVFDTRSGLPVEEAYNRHLEDKRAHKCS